MEPLEEKGVILRKENDKDNKTHVSWMSKDCAEENECRSVRGKEKHERLKQIIVIPQIMVKTKNISTHENDIRKPVPSQSK